VRAVAYDRAGLGDSDPDPQIPSAERAVADLSTLISLVSAEPCVVAGHSSGGLLAAERSARHGVAPGSGHAVHQHSPALVADAILDLISWG